MARTPDRTSDGLREGSRPPTVPTRRWRRRPRLRSWCPSSSPCLLWWAIWFFDGTLDTTGAGLSCGRLAEAGRGAGRARRCRSAADAASWAARRSAARCARGGNLTDGPGRRRRLSANGGGTSIGFGLTALIARLPVLVLRGRTTARYVRSCSTGSIPLGHLGDLAPRLLDQHQDLHRSPRSSSSCGRSSWPSCGSIPGRAGAPLRWLAIAYTDLFRGIPALLVIYLVVFGFPLAGVPFFSSLEPRRHSCSGWRCSPSRSPTAPTCPRCTGPGSRASTGARRPRPARSGCRMSRPSATSSCPRRCGASSRRC